MEDEGERQKLKGTQNHLPAIFQSGREEGATAQVQSKDYARRRKMRVDLGRGD